MKYPVVMGEEVKVNACRYISDDNSCVPTTDNDGSAEIVIINCGAVCIAHRINRSTHSLVNL